MFDYKNINRRYLFIALIIIFALVRLYMGMNIHSWFYLTSKHDDLLLLSYSNLYDHFHSWNIESLAKTMSYPLFLSFVNFSGIALNFWIALLWIIAGLFTIYAVNKFITKNKLILLLSFIFIIFLPAGFDVYFLEIYRNSIMAQFSIITFASLFTFINFSIEEKKNNKVILFWGILTGLLFTFNYYIKEDGIMTLPIFLVSLLAILAFNLYNNRRNLKSKNTAKLFILALIPLLIFAGLTEGYKEINNYYFGVADINTRTSGELGEFWSNLLIIDDDNKSTKIWVPFSTIEKAWNASPTLQTHPELLDNWQHTGWFDSHDLNKTPLPGDITAWSLRDALNDSGLYDNEKEADSLFKDVNDELDEAFENGDLNKSDKIFITHSANGKTFDEVKGIKIYCFYALDFILFNHNVEYQKYMPGTSKDVSNKLTVSVGKTVNENLSTPKELPFVEKTLLDVDLIIYEYVSYVIVLLSAISFIGICIYQFKHGFKERHFNALAGYQLMLLGTIVLIVFAVSWFCSWMDLNNHIIFYTISAYGIFTFFEVIAIAGGYKIIKKIRGCN